MASSKYHPEYSGSGLRAHNTYKRFEKKFDIECEIIINSIIYKGNKKYRYEDKEIYRISSPLNINKNNPLKKIFVFYKILWEIFYGWRFIRKNIDNYDLLHTFGNTWTIGFLSWYFAKKNKPIMRELCNDMENPFYPIQAKNYMKAIFKKNNTLMIAISKKLENLAIKFGVKNIWVRPNPVNEKIFFVDYKKKFLLRTNLTKFNQNDKVLSQIANFIENKNQLFSLDVLSLLPANFKLILAGPLKEENKDYFQLILKKIDDLNLHDRVDLQVGFIENFDEYLKCSDIFLFPSKSEGLGTPILESLACGVPVVSNHIKEVTDTFIKNNENGYYLNLDEKKWAKIIPKVLGIPHEVLVNNAKYIISKSSSQVIDEEYFNRIKNLISSES